jgi:hypothetical protein
VFLACTETELSSKIPWRFSSKAACPEFRKAAARISIELSMLPSALSELLLVSARSDGIAGDRD